MNRRQILFGIAGLSLFSLSARPVWAQEWVGFAAVSTEIIPLLSAIDTARPLESLTEDEVKELQQALNRLGYESGPVDGLVGTRTRTAWAEFKADIFQGDSDLIGPGSITLLQEKLEAIGPGIVHDFSTIEGTIEAIKYECRSLEIGLDTQIAYVLATVEHETARTFQPVREAFWLSEAWRQANLRYYPYYGRGYVQLTWQENYEKYSHILGIDLISNPDLAMDPNVALFILVHGFKTGAFTGRKITDYINASRTDFVEARRCINGTDKQFEIAALAERYLATL